MTLTAVQVIDAITNATPGSINEAWLNNMLASGTGDNPGAALPRFMADFKSN